MLITQPIGKKNRNGPRTCLMGPGGVVWGEKTEYKKSRETVPLISTNCVAEFSREFTKFCQMSV